MRRCASEGHSSASALGAPPLEWCINTVVAAAGIIEEATQEKVVGRKIAKAKDAKAAGKVEGDAVEIFQPAAEVTPADLAPPEPKTIGEVANQSATKDQAQGQATTEEMLVPPEIQKVQDKRKAVKPAKGETPEGGEPAAPPAGGEVPLSPSAPARSTRHRRCDAV